MPSSAGGPRNDVVLRRTDMDPPEVIDREVKVLLSKLTVERFEDISYEVIHRANKSEKEKDGRTLKLVIDRVFEKATSGAAYSGICARLCQRMMIGISPSVQDDGNLDTEGKPYAGAQLFRKYLLNRCQEDFERGLEAKKIAAPSYAAIEAKRNRLGLIRFIGELFKLKLLTERIMHECIKMLLVDVGDPGEEQIEILCDLLATVGEIIDVPEARANMDFYFLRMKVLADAYSCMATMLQEAIKLRENGWTLRKWQAVPVTPTWYPSWLPCLLFALSPWLLITLLLRM